MIPLSVDQVETLAADLLRALTPAAGDSSAVDAVMLRGLDAIDADTFACICIAAVRIAFAECMTPVDTPPGALALRLPERTPTDD